MDASFEEKLRRFGDDTVVRCPKCGRTQTLKFENGLRNGWSKCCGGFTMPIIYILDKEKTIDHAVSSIVSKASREALADGC